jgi:protein-disulfide isomerase
MAQQSEVLATVNGKPITETDVFTQSVAEFRALKEEYEKNLHDLLEAKLQQLIETRLLEAEAQAAGITSQQVLANIKPAEVTDADVDAFFEENKARIPKSKEEIAGQLREYLARQRESEARATFIKSLEEKYKVVITLEPLRVEVAATGPAVGPANAPVTIVEFTDFQCPFCSRVIPTLEEVRAKYGDKVRLVVRQFPLNIHPNARKAAEASLCANEQGKFRELHDAMFRNQQELAVNLLKSKAAELGMNAEQFNACLDSGKYAGQVEADVRAGEAVGVTGTPALFINGRLVSGAVPLEQVTKVIDDELRRKGVKSPQ